MDQSFDPTDLSLSGAADMVAIRVQLGVVAHPPVTKEAGVVSDLLAKLKNMDNPLANFDISNPAHAAMLGGGVGMGGGLLATIMSKRKKKRWLRNMLMGGALGAGIGGAGSYMAKAGPPLFETETTKLQARADVIEATLGKMRSGEMAGTSEQLAALANELAKIKLKIDPPKPTPTPDAAGRMRTLRLNLGEGDLTGAAKNMLNWGWHDATNKPVNTLASTALGLAAGERTDALRAMRYRRSQKGLYAAERTAPVSGKEIKRFEARMTAPFTAQEARSPAAQKNIPPEILKQMAATTDAPVKPQPQSQPKPQPQPGKPKIVTGVGTPSLPPFGRPAGNKPPVVPPLLGPSGSSMALPIRRPPAPGIGSGDMFKGVDIQPHKPQIQANVEEMRRDRATKLHAAKPPRTGFLGRPLAPRSLGPAWRHAGKYTGAGLGAAASLFSDWGANPAEAARSFRP